MKKKYLIPFILLIATGLALLIYPHIEIQTEDKLIACSYSDDISKFETEISLNENYTYYGKRDISLTSYDFQKFLFFYILIFDYQEGNLCDTEFMLEESYIEDFLEHAVIEENLDDIDLAALIDGRKAIVSNQRYFCPEDTEPSAIYYTLHDEEQVMFVYETDGLLVIRIGYPDEGPKYIAYK